MSGEKLTGGGVLPPFAINSVTSASANGGVTFLTISDAALSAAESDLLRGPPPR
jgi:hypothetical protein